MTLYPHQEKMAARHVHLLRARGVTSDRSETGVGKTLSILAAAKELGVSFAVVCPKILVSHWRHWCSQLGLRPVSVAGWEAVKLGKIPQLYLKGRWLKDSNARILIIFDEAHRAKSKGTLAQKMVAAAANQGHLVALLSATLITSPLDLLGLGVPLRLVKHQKDVFTYARRYGVGLNRRWGGYEDYSSTSQREELKEILDRVGTRVLRGEIRGHRAALVQADLVDGGQEVALAYEALTARLKDLEQKKAAAIEAVTVRLRGRQAAELAKVPLFVEETLKHLAEGARVVCFFCFHESIQTALSLFESHHISPRLIEGYTSPGERDAAQAAFNFGSCPVLLCNIAAGGEGISLHDSDGQFPRVALLSIPESSNHLIQSLGRIDRVGSRSVGLNRILFAAGTVEEDVYENIVHKLTALDQINDQDLSLLTRILKK